MTEHTDLMKADPFISALTREHFATPGGYRPPEDVDAARKALSDLVARRVVGTVKERDYHRLAARYGATIKAHEDALMAKHSATAPTSENGATP